MECDWEISLRSTCTPTATHVRLRRIYNEESSRRSWICSSGSPGRHTSMSTPTPIPGSIRSTSWLERGMVEMPRSMNSWRASTRFFRRPAGRSGVRTCTFRWTTFTKLRSLPCCEFRTRTVDHSFELARATPSHRLDSRRGPGRGLSSGAPRQSPTGTGVARVRTLRRHTDCRSEEPICRTRSEALEETPPTTLAGCL